MSVVSLQYAIVLLENAEVIKKCVGFITKRDSYYKMRWYNHQLCVVFTEVHSLLND